MKSSISATWQGSLEQQSLAFISAVGDHEIRLAEAMGTKMNFFAEDAPQISEPLAEDSRESEEGESAG